MKTRDSRVRQSLESKPKLDFYFSQNSEEISIINPHLMEWIMIWRVNFIHLQAITRFRRLSIRGLVSCGWAAPGRRAGVVWRNLRGNWPGADTCHTRPGLDPEPRNRLISLRSRVKPGTGAPQGSMFTPDHKATPILIAIRWP